LKVFNFLFPGLVIGWLSLIGYIISLLTEVVGIIFASIFTCEDASKFLEKIYEMEGKEKDENYFKIYQFMEEHCGTMRGVFIALLVIGIIISLGFIYISYLCIKGTQNVS
jgi:amino acid transporter